MINVSPDLQKTMMAVRREAVRTDAVAAIKAADVLLIFLAGFMNRTPDEEFLCVESLQPGRLPYLLQQHI